MFGIRKQNLWWARTSGVAAVVIGVVSIIGALMLAPASMAAEYRSATSVLAALSINDAPAVGVAGFTGDYGTADTPDLSQASSADDGDFSDPDGVLSYVTVKGTQLAATSWDRGTTQLTARANATAFALKYNNVTDFLTSGSVDSYARCLDRGGALAYARGDGSLTYVLGRGVPTGVPTTINVTGAQLKMPNVASGTLTVTVTPVENTVNSPTAVSAEAYLEMKITADLKDASGATVYSGGLLDMKVGHVKVTCRPSVMPSSSSITSSSSGPSSSSATASSESPTSQSPSSETPTSDRETPTSVTPTSPSETPTSATPTSPSEAPTTAPSSSGSSSGSGSPSSGSSSDSEAPSSSKSSSHGVPVSTAAGGSDDGDDGDFGPLLPTTGGAAGTVLTGLVIGLAVALVGIVMLNIAARRSRN